MEIEGITSHGDEANHQIPRVERCNTTEHVIQSFLALQKEALGTFFSQQVENLGRLTSK